MGIGDFGKRNNVIINKNDLPQVNIEIYGDDNVIDIGRLYLSKGQINIKIFGSLCKVCIGKSICVGRELNIRIGKDKSSSVLNSKVIIGNKTTIEQLTAVNFENDTVIDIGKSCMISSDVLLYNTDGYPIYHNDCEVAYNNAKSIVVADNVWLGAYTKILKNSYIAEGCIVGMQSLLSGKYKKKKCIIAGNPAKVVKTNVCYQHSDPNWINTNKFTPWKAIKHNNDVLLTVYILTYNHEKTIEKTLKSVLNQKTKFPYIIKILEDCSTDNTLSICKRYQSLYPDRIEIIAQPVNTNTEHSLWAKKRIDTKYWCTLEGDDYWCDDTKIDQALTILESNDKYIGFGHDTICINSKKQTRSSVYHGNVKYINSRERSLISFNNLHYIHTSAIIYRHIIDFNQYGLPLIDTYILYYHLSFGNVYYYDKVMSCHPQTGYGIWSSLSEKTRNFNNEYIHYHINKYLKFQYDRVFTRTVRHVKMLKLFKLVLGKRIGWGLYILHAYTQLSILNFCSAIAKFVTKGEN